MKVQIYAMTHKKFTPPSDPMYIPLQVGRAAHEPLGYLGDDTGDSISSLNCYYSELTGMYWVWKNVHDCDVIGICHYRRYLLNDKEELLSQSEIDAILKEYDVITTKCLDLNFSYEYGFQQNHTVEDLQAANNAIAKLYPDFYPLYLSCLKENHTYFGNMMICSKELYDKYCEFLFPIFQEMSHELDLDSYDDYHKRLYGFISEFIWMVWVKYQGLHPYECKVGLVGEKKETTEVISHIWDMLYKKEITGAKTYFLSAKEKRPDLLMEASDIHNHLHICLQVISTCEFESDTYGKILLPISDLYGIQLMEYMDKLNRYSIELLAHIAQNTVDANYLDKIKGDFKELNCSPIAMKISLKLYADNSTDYETACEILHLQALPL